MSFSSVSSDFVKLGSTSASGSTSISVDGYFTSAYDFYMVRILGCTATVGGQDLHLRFNRSGSAVTTSNYTFQVGRLYGNSSVDNSGLDNTSGYRVWYGTTGNEKTHATLWFYNPLASEYPSMWYNANAWSGGNSFNLFGSVALKTTGAISGFTLYNGTMSIDNITIYGMKD